MTKKPRIANVGLLALGAGLLLLLFLNNFTPASTSLKYSEVMQLFENNEVASFTMDVGNGSLEYKLRDETTEKYKMAYSYLFIQALPEYVASYNEKYPDTPIEYDLKQSGDFSGLLVWLPSLLMLLVIGALFYYFIMMQCEGGKGAMGVNKATVKNQAESKNKATFKDVAGAEEEKEELDEIVSFLKNPRRLTLLGSVIL